MPSLWMPSVYNPGELLAQQRERIEELEAFTQTQLDLLRAAHHTAHHAS